MKERLTRARFPLRGLGEIAPIVQYGCSQRASIEKIGVPILRMNNLQADGWALDDLKFIELTAEELRRWQLEPGQILFNRTNSKELVGKCEVFREKGVWAFASYLMRVVIDESLVVPEFVAAFLNGPTGRAQIERDSRQIIGMTNINAEEIRALRIPLPDLSTQRALLATLGEARAARDAALADADRLLNGLDAYVLHALDLAFPPQEAETRPFAIKQWDIAMSRLDVDFHRPRFQALRRNIETFRHEVKPISDIFMPLVTGFAAGFADQADEADGGVPHIRPLNLKPTGEITLAGTKRVPTATLQQRDFISQGEILFNNTNSSAWVGKSAVFDLPHACAASNHITRMILKDPKHSAQYFAALLNGFRSVGYFSALATNFNNQAGINAETLALMRIPVPHPDEQAQIAAEVTRVRSDAHRMQAGARADWEAARQAFEMALLGPESPAGAAP